MSDDNKPSKKGKKRRRRDPTESKSAIIRGWKKGCYRFRFLTCKQCCIMRRSNRFKMKREAAKDKEEAAWKTTQNKLREAQQNASRGEKQKGAATCSICNTVVEKGTQYCRMCKLSNEYHCW